MYKYNIKNVNIDNCTNGHPILFVSCCCNGAVHIFGISSVLIILLLKKITISSLSHLKWYSNSRLAYENRK